MMGGSIHNSTLKEIQVIENTQTSTFKLFEDGIPTELNPKKSYGDGTVLKTSLLLENIFKENTNPDILNIFGSTDDYEHGGLIKTFHDTITSYLVN